MAEKITISAPFSQESRSLGRIGRVGENLSRQIVFDCTSALTDRPNANIVCVIQRTGDKQPYAAQMTRLGDTGIYKLVLTSTEVAKPGSVRFELRMVDGEEILKAAIYTGTVEASMSGIGDTPGEPIPDALNRLETAISEVGKYADLKKDVETLQTSGASTAEVADTNAVSIHGADGVYDLSKGTIQARLNDLETGEGLNVEKSTVNTLDLITGIAVKLPSFEIEAGKMYMHMPEFEIHSTTKSLSDAFIFIRNWNNTQGSAPVILLPAIYETSTNYVRGYVCAFNPTPGPISVTRQTVTVEAYKRNGHTFVTNVSGNVINGGTSSTKIANGTGMAQVGTGKELVVDYSATGFTSAPVVVASHCQTGDSDTDTSGIVKVLSVTKTGCKISIIGGTPDHDYPVSWIATGT